MRGHAAQRIRFGWEVRIEAGLISTNVNATPLFLRVSPQGKSLAFLGLVAAREFVVVFFPGCFLLETVDFVVVFFFHNWIF